ncbi:MAG TPA: hypothetical protein VF703_07390 [Pyrinomonadaceae bacterium]|jgi:hypothetical protein
MKSYRNAVATLVLALVFSTSAFAGVIQTGVTGPDPQPTPTVSSTTETTTTDGVIQTGKAASTPGATDTLTGIALNLLQGVFSLF